MSSLLVILFSIITVYRVYKRRHLFKQLTKQEWQQYVAGACLAWAVAVAIIFGSASLVHALDVESFRFVIAIISILIALQVAKRIVDRFVPARVKEIWGR